MSYEFLFKHLLEYDLLKKVLMNENQIYLFDHIPKIDLDKLETDPGEKDIDKILEESTALNTQNESIQKNILNHFSIY
jgi:hypothetical protein